jgi:hypothetical protein
VCVNDGLLSSDISASSLWYTIHFLKCVSLSFLSALGSSVAECASVRTTSNSRVAVCAGIHSLWVAVSLDMLTFLSLWAVVLRDALAFFSFWSAVKFDPKNFIRRPLS